MFILMPWIAGYAASDSFSYLHNVGMFAIILSWVPGIASVCYFVVRDYPYKNPARWYFFWITVYYIIMYKVFV